MPEKRLEYVAHPEDFKRFNRVRKAMGVKPLDRPDSDCPRGYVQIIINQKEKNIE